MFEDSPTGATYYCKHKNSNPSGVCDECLPKTIKKWDKEIEEQYDKYATTSNRYLLSDFQNAIRIMAINEIYKHRDDVTEMRVEELKDVILKRMCDIETIKLRIK